MDDALLMPTSLIRREDEEDGTLVKLLPPRSRVSRGDVTEMLLRTDAIDASPRPCDVQLTVMVVVLPAVRSQLQVAMEAGSGHQQMAVVRAENSVESSQMPSLTKGKYLGLNTSHASSLQPTLTPQAKGSAKNQTKNQLKMT